MWFKKKEEEVVDVIEYPKPGELWETNGYEGIAKYLYITCNDTPTLEGSGYTYVYAREDCSTVNKRAISEPRHINDSVDKGELIRNYDETLIAKILLLSME